MKKDGNIEWQIYAEVIKKMRTKYTKKNIYDYNIQAIFTSIKKRNKFYNDFFNFIEITKELFDNMINQETFDLLKTVDIDDKSKKYLIRDSVIEDFIFELTCIIKNNNNLQNADYKSSLKIKNELLKNHKLIKSLETISGTFYIYRKIELTDKELEIIKNFFNTQALIITSMIKMFGQKNNNLLFIEVKKEMVKIHKILLMENNIENFKLKHKMKLMRLLYNPWNN